MVVQRVGPEGSDEEAELHEQVLQSAATSSEGRCAAHRVQVLAGFAERVPALASCVAGFLQLGRALAAVRHPHIFEKLLARSFRRCAGAGVCASRSLALVARAYSVGRREVRVCPCVYLLFARACVVGARSAGKSQLRSFQRYRGLWGSGVVLRCRKHGSLTLLSIKNYV